MSRPEELPAGQGEEAGGGRAEGPSATGDGGQAAISPTPDDGGTHVHVFEGSQLEDWSAGGLCCQRGLEENRTTGSHITIGEAERRARLC